MGLAGMHAPVNTCHLTQQQEGHQKPAAFMNGMLSFWMQKSAPIVTNGVAFKEHVCVGLGDTPCDVEMCTGASIQSPGI